MSRCFPFPPPGYEGKHRPEGLSVLKEAKHKEKREKKDKERRKDREKKDKDRNSEKHGSKKDRKEKHKEKKEKHRDKKKDKNKEDEKNSMFSELEQRSGKKVHPEGHSFDGSNSVSIERCSILSQGNDGVRPFQGILASHAPTEEKFIQELNKRIREDDKISRNQLPERDATMEKWCQIAPGDSVVYNSMEITREKGHNRHKGIKSKNVDVHFLDERKTKPENHARDAGVKVEGTTPRVVEFLQDKMLVDEQKSIRAVNDKGREELADRNMKVHGKDKEKRSDLKLEEKQKIKIEKIDSESKNVGRAHNSRNGDMSLDLSPTVNEGNVRKRKEIGINDFLHDGEIRPNKIHLTTIHSSTLNGRKPLISQIPSKSSEKPVFPNSDQLDHKDWLTNGIVKPQNVSSLRPNASGVVASSGIPVALKSPCHASGKASAKSNVPSIEDLLNEASRKPPHPDSKYLSQVLRVPSVGQWSEFDDQEWLFSKKDPPPKPEPDLASGTGEMRVWSKALHIESADIYALPYVIPY